MWWTTAGEGDAWRGRGVGRLGEVGKESEAEAGVDVGVGVKTVAEVRIGAGV